MIEKRDTDILSPDRNAQEHYTRSGEFGDVLFGQWLPRTFTAKTADELRRITLSAREGDILFFKANGVSTWQFRFDKSLSSLYPWQFVGGGPIHHEIETSEATASATLADLATVGPYIDMPLAGDFMVSFGCEHFSSTANTVGQLGVLSTLDGVTFSSISNTIDSASSAILAADTGASARTFVYKNTSGSKVVQIRIRYLSLGGIASANFRKRFLSLTPLRVG